MKLIAEISDENLPLELVGAKAWNLSRLSCWGIPIPPTWVITTEATKMLEGFEPTTHEKWEQTSLWEKIIILQDELHRRFGSTQVYAIRSSGVIEDSKDLSFAGMLDSYLGVPVRAISCYVLRCLESIKNHRVVTYAHIRNQEVAKIAVIIQPMISCDLSGVLFTADPVDCRDSVIVIESAPGNCSQLVEGSINPFCIQMDKKQLKLLSVEGEEQFPGFLDLYLDTFRRVAKMAVSVERNAGYPVDVEWGIGRDLYFFQFRPITSL